MGSKIKTNITRIIFLGIAIFFVIGWISPSVFAATVLPQGDDILSKRYERFLKYEKYQLYKQYKKVKDYKSYKKYADLYELYKKNPKKYRGYAAYKSYYDDYQKYKEKRKYASYGKYAFFNNDKNKKYSTAVYKEAYDRVKLNAAAVTSAAVSTTTQSQPAPVDPINYVGSPKIRVGLTYFKKSSLEDKAITVKVNSNSTIREAGGSVLEKIPNSTEIRIFFDFSSKEYRVVSVNIDKKTEKPIVIEPENKEQGVCEVTNVGSYRGTIEVRFASFTKNLWVINELPIEQYVWGMGEAVNVSPNEYLKALSVAYRTYGYWKVVNGSSNTKEGFDVTDTGANQVYGGYGREYGQPNIVTAAKATSGIVVKYGDIIAITPYSSGTDGNTRSWKDVWGSDNFPWCQAVPDPLGIKSNASTLSGNHMVGMSATGAYNFAKQQSWTYDKILTYYYKGVSLVPGW